MESTSSQWRTKGVEVDETPFRHKTHLLCWECGLRREHIFHRGCIVSILKVIQYQTRHGSDQPALADPVLSRHLGFRRNLGVPSKFKCYVILWISNCSVQLSSEDWLVLISPLGIFCLLFFLVYSWPLHHSWIDIYYPENLKPSKNTMYTNLHYVWQKSR